MKIIVDRDSVCAGDDIYYHEMTFEVPESLTVAEFFDFVNSHGFLAFIQGNDVAWGLQNRSESILQKQEKSLIQKLKLKIKWMKLVAILNYMYAIIVTRNGQKRTVIENKREERIVYRQNQ